MTPHKIPKEDFTYQIIRDVIRKRGFIETQTELCELVTKRLKKYNKKFVISPKRVREIALKIPKVRIKTETRRSPITKKIKNCPVCEGRVKKIYGTNLMDKEVHIGYKCMKCNFSAEVGSLIPMRYVFVWKK